MKQEEKWPVFQPSPKMERKSARQDPSTHQNINGGGQESSEVMFEEMSGMVTLKRKGKENHGNEQAAFDNHPGLQSLF